MNRRELFSSLARSGRRESMPVPTDRLVLVGAEQHTGPLTLADVHHIIRRLGVGATVAQANAFVGKTADEVVESLLGPNETQHPDPPGAWVDAATENPLGADLQTRNAIESSWYANHASLSGWWVRQLARDLTATEKLVLFWSNHWTTEFSFDETVSIPQTLYRQMKVLRTNRLGDLRDLALEMTVDNAMVWYLGGHFNQVGKPNENYARELMELFLTGIGWYTEGDVREAARVLTGWRASRYNDEPAPQGIYETWFDAAAHDTGAKTVLGVTIPGRTKDNNTAFQVKMEEVYELIKIIVRQRPEAVSRFIAEKFYRFYVYSSPVDGDAEFISDVARIFREADFNIRALMKAIFTSAHFFDAANRGVQIKTPLEFVCGLERQLGVNVPTVAEWLTRMDQTVLDPPTVAGWPGYRSWISTNTYPVRRQLASDMLSKVMSNANLYNIFSSFDTSSKDAFLDAVLTHFLPVPVSQARRENYLTILSQTERQLNYTWTQVAGNEEAAARALRDVLGAIFRAPDFQLC